jgi:uncharacterized SAM-binding protein YcdF (DUF218 family)
MGRRLKILIVLIVGMGGWVLIAPSLATCLIVERPLDHADAIILLSGSAVYKERAKKAAELYKEGVAPRIFITDDGGRTGWLDSEQKNLPFVELEQRDLIARGVSPEAITVLPGVVSGTDDEAKAILAEIDVRPIGSLLIVTSAYHSRRALRTFDKILAGKGVTIGLMHAPNGERTPDPGFWWLSPRGWQTVAGEYVKSVVYWVFY